MMRPAKDTLFALLSLGPLARGRASILMYHSVGENGKFFTVSPRAFERQLAFLAERAYSVIRLSELVDRLRAGASIDRCVALTFDDGYRDNYTEVLPRLARYRFPATVFLTTGLVGKGGGDTPLLTGEDIQAMKESGLIEFMPHGVSHLNLDELSHEEAAREIELSREKVRILTGSPADMFAFPRGRSTPALVEYLRRAGFRAAVSVREGLVARGAELFALPRNSIDSTTSLIQFKGKVSPAIDRYAALKQWFTRSRSR